MLSTLAREKQEGRFFSDGIRVTNVEADLSTVPDGTYVLFKSFVSGRVKLIEGQEHGFVGLEGSADMLLEVVSDSSEQKDLIQLRQQYWEAGVQEYWIVDARRAPLEFTMLRRGAKGFATTRKQDGWLKSAVFGKSFRLTQQFDALGNPQYTLDVR